MPSPIPEDLTDQIFGNLKPIQYLGNSKWLCLNIETNRESKVLASNLKRGKSSGIYTSNLKRRKSSGIYKAYGVDVPDENPFKKIQNIQERNNLFHELKSKLSYEEMAVLSTQAGYKISKQRVWVICNA